jgi:hypothetical protein
MRFHRAKWLLFSLLSSSLAFSAGAAPETPHHSEVQVMSETVPAGAVVTVFDAPWLSFETSLIFALAQSGDFIYRNSKGGEKTPFYCLIGGTDDHPKYQAGFLYDGNADLPAPLKKVYLPSGKLLEATHFGGIGMIKQSIDAMIDYAKAHKIKIRAESPCVFFAKNALSSSADLGMQIKFPYE